MSGVTHDGKGWSNADQDRVELVAYDPSWPAQYEAEAGAIRAALAGLADFELGHFGSTAIPGLAAKPIIDIMLVSADQSAWPAILFCEHLRRHPEEAARYAALKSELSARYPTDRDAYTEGKARYVDDIVRKAGTP